MQQKIIIIGGGASGLMCALKSSQNKNNQITILEAGSKVGRKILASGNGKCNLTNITLSDDCYNNFPQVYFDRFNQQQTLNLFYNLGLHTYNDDYGRCYPISNHSHSVLQVLLNNIGSNVTTHLNSAVTKIEKNQNGFNIYCGKQRFVADKVVVAVGGNAGKELLSFLDLQFNNFKPSLCGLTVKQPLKGLEGVRISNTKATANNVCVNGEIIFKSHTVSGICMFDLSAKLNWQNKIKSKLSLDLLNMYTEEQLLTTLTNRVSQLSNLTIGQFFDGLLIDKLANYLIEKLKLAKIKKISTLTTANLNDIVTNLKQFELDITGYDQNNQVHTGGVSLSELDKNLMIKNQPNIYLCGEVIDIDGICGGFNLQWAWTSGYIVGEELC